MFNLLAWVSSLWWQCLGSYCETNVAFALSHYCYFWLLSNKGCIDSLWKVDRWRPVCSRHVSCLSWRSQTSCFTELKLLVYYLKAMMTLLRFNWEVLATVNCQWVANLDNWTTSLLCWKNCIEETVDGHLCFFNGNVTCSCMMVAVTVRVWNSFNESCKHRLQKSLMVR